jgi:superfamily I DNA/RNA helicase
LAHKHLNFDLEELEPLSLDGREGRRLQAELIDSVLNDMMKSKIVQNMYSDLSQQVMSDWEAVVSGSSKKLVGEIMHEFASVLDAEAIRAGEEKGEKYAKSPAGRPAWLMLLPKEKDRRFVLDVHRRYRKVLGDMNALSVDQMVGDFNSFLESNRWDRIRHREGFDVLFVDELHLFTSIERQTLHKLIRKNVEDDGRPRRPPIFMAYDLKQSPRDTFAQYGEGDQSLFSASTGLQGSELVKLEKVFRYTPQIAEFLTDLDASFPAVDIPGEWDAYSGKPVLDDGQKPDITVFNNESALFASVMKEAARAAGSIAGGGRRVAVLCASEELFDQYVNAASGQFARKHIAITSREPSSELRHAGKRFILSMPEYVAGLQFDTVFLINVDAADAPIDAGDGIRRRFISNIYLGSSRAEQKLHLSACSSRGGRSDVLDMAIERRSLREAMPSTRKN